MSRVEYSNVEQNTEEWLRLRIGVPTASIFGTIMANGPKSKETRKALLRTMAGEVLTGEPYEKYTNAAMQRGHDMEGEARDTYALTNGVHVERIGFVVRTLPSKIRVGCSPDGIIGNDGVLEIKTKAPKFLIPIDMGEDQNWWMEHNAQCQGVLWVTGRQWCDLVAYYRGMPRSVVYRIKRNETYIENLAKTVEEFARDMRQIVEAMRK